MRAANGIAPDRTDGLGPVQIASARAIDQDHDARAAVRCSIAAKRFARGYGIGALSNRQNFASRETGAAADRICHMASQALLHENRIEESHPGDGRKDDPLLARKLDCHQPLSRIERDVLAKALSLDVRTVQQRTILLEQGAAATKLAVMLEGWACRKKMLPDGRRQIVAFYLPGDVCDFSVLMAPAIDSTIELLPGARVAGISREALGALNRNQPRITRGLWWESQAATAIQREWMVNIGQRSALARIAHLLCEIVTRLDAVGLVKDGQCALPISQIDLGDACAMTTAHTNRTLRQLRDEGLITWRSDRLKIHDLTALVAIAEFSAAYLQFISLEESTLLAL
jgi:CRP-like cAMP-binding protein